MDIFNTANVEITGNLIKKTIQFSLTSKIIENTLSKNKYHGVGLEKDPLVENTKLPPMALIFYNEVFTYGNIPSPKMFILRYIETYFDTEKREDNKVYAIMKSNPSIVLSAKGLQARIIRTYPSLVRDLHLLLKMKENGYQVSYSFKKDYEDGIDIELTYNGVTYPIALMTNTKRSMEFLNKKVTTRHSRKENLIEIPLSFEDTMKCGDYFVYQESHILHIINIIKNIEAKKEQDLKGNEDFIKETL